MRCGGRLAKFPAVGGPIGGLWERASGEVVVWGFFLQPSDYDQQVVMDNIRKILLFFVNKIRHLSTILYYELFKIIKTI